jgi:uncharacterized membrane protein (GlpM family)
VDGFALRLLLSFALGGLSVAIFTTLAERHGSRLGGLLLSFPVKVVIALVLIALNEGIGFAAQAAVAVPAGIAVNVVFLVSTALLVRRLRPWPALLGALGIWLVAGLVLVLVPLERPLLALACWAASAAVALALLARIPGLRGDRRSRRVDAGRFGLGGLLARAAGAGTVVALSVVLAHYAGPVLGGLASVFPSGWITTMVILTRNHGPDFTGATTRVMVAGSGAPVAFGLAVALAYPRVGVAWGTVAAIGAAALVSLGVGWLLARLDGPRPAATGLAAEGVAALRKEGEET